MTRLSVDRQTLLRLCSLADPKPKYAFSVLGGAQVLVRLPEAEVVCDVLADLEAGEAPVASVTEELEKLGIAVLQAEVLDDADQSLSKYWLAVVAYNSEEPFPGIWVSAYPAQPSAGEVLTDIYGEFFEEGDLGALTFDDFERIARPHVMILSSDDLRKFLGESDRDRDDDHEAHEDEFEEYELDAPSIVREGRADVVESASEAEAAPEPESEESEAVTESGPDSEEEAAERAGS